MVDIAVILAVVAKALEAISRSEFSVADIATSPRTVSYFNAS